MIVLPHVRSVSLPAGTRTRLAIAATGAGLALAGAFAISSIGGGDDGVADRAARGPDPTVPMRFDDPTVQKGARGGNFDEPLVVKGARGAPLD
jgi:hypothetical protein